MHDPAPGAADASHRLPQVHGGAPENKGVWGLQHCSSIRFTHRVALSAQSALLR